MRIDQLTFTRFVAAVPVLIFHYGEKIYPFDPDSFLFDRSTVAISVSYFFMLTGFVMIIAYHQNSSINAFEYMKRRFARIYPAYLLAILILLINFILLNKHIDYIGLALNILSIQSWVPGKALSFNFPSWSLSIEFFFYSTFPLLYNYVYSKKAISYYLLPIVIFWLATQIFLHWFIQTDFYHKHPMESFELAFLFPPMHFNEFLLGNLLGVIYIRRLQHNHGNYDWVVIILLLFVVITLSYFPHLHFENGLLAFLLIPFIAIIAMNNGLITSIFKSKVCVFLGEISYGMYILQVPVFEWSKDLFRYFGIDNPSLIFYISIICLLLVASLSFIFIETPLRRYINRFKIVS